MKTKGDFILELLSNKKISGKDRERILNLSAKQFEKNDVEYQKILFEINGLKKKFEIDQTKLNTKIDFILEEFQTVIHENSKVEETENSISLKNTTVNSESIKEIGRNASKIEIIDKTITKIDSDVITWLQLNKFENPKNQKDFLVAYNQNPILNSTCHLVDEDGLIEINKIMGLEEYNFEKHLEYIQKAFYSLDKKYRNADYKLKGRVRVYLTGKDKKGVSNTWSTDIIKVNWACSELIKWANENPGIPPNPDLDVIKKVDNIGFEFDEFDVKSRTSKIQTFSELVIHFKHMFHIRSDNTLKELIQNINIYEGWNEIIDFDIEHKDFWSNIELFIDVDKLIQAYGHIIKMILKIQKEHNLIKPKIVLKFKEVEGTIIFSIHHKNAVFKKTISNIINRPGKDLKSLIENKINGLCFLYLKADFDNNQFAEINLWNGLKIESRNIMSFEGVEHILKFPK